MLLIPWMIPPLLQRKLRAMSTAFVIILSLATAGVLAWSVHRYELGRDAQPTACSRVLDEVFADGAVNSADSVILARLLQHRADCIGDPAYVDQARRLMVNTQKVDQARALLEEADGRGTFKPDELKAQLAWVDLGDAQLAWTNGMAGRAEELRVRAVTTANDLRSKWPEWSLPYRILEEAGRASWAPAEAKEPTDYFQLERSARGRLVTGAFARTLGDWQPVVFVFVVGSIGMFGLCAGVGGLIGMREMTQAVTSTIAEAQPGYVELKGTLHLPPNAAPVIGPYSKTHGVWYEVRTRSSFKGSRTRYERSLQPFLLQDASGEVVIDPHGITVRTKHSAASFGNDGGVSWSRRVFERMLQDGDSAYVLGELRDVAALSGAHTRRLGIAENGRRLLVSNLSEEQLLFIERLWFWIGTSLFVLTVIVLAWGYYQRYQVNAVPGVLL